MNPPLVSICIPTYQRPTLLQRAIGSVLRQTFQNFEIVITDNSEDTESEEAIRALNDPRIRYLRNEKNLGCFANIQKVATLAEGRYFTVLMDDDLLKPRFLELMLGVFAKHPSVGIVMAPLDLIDSNDRRIFPRFYFVRKMHYRYRYQVGDGFIERARVLKDFLTRDYPCCVPSGIMYRTEAVRALGGFDTRSDFALDVDLAMRMAVRHDFYYIDQVLSSFRYTPASNTAAVHSSGSNVAVFYLITRKILADPEAVGLFPKSDHKRLVRDSFYFCSCRALLLNSMAGLRARNWKLIANTVRLVFREDPYFWNKIRVPFFALREVCRSFGPPARPLPAE